MLVLGEDVAEGGPWGATAGLAEEFGAERVRNTPISEAAICGIAIGAAQSGLRPVVEIMFIDFVTLALDQLVNQAAKAHFMSGGQLDGAARPADAGWGRPARRRPALAEPRGVADARAGAEGRHAEHGRRRRRAARARRSPTRTRSSSSRTRRSTSAESRRHEPCAVPIGRARIVRPGRDVTVVALVAPRPRGARGGRRAGGGGHRGRGDRPAHARPARPRHDRRVRLAHAPARRRPRGRRARRLRRRDRRPGAGGRVRRARRADRARRRAVRADPVQPAARRRVPPRPRRGCGGGTALSRRARRDRLDA